MISVPTSDREPGGLLRLAMKLPGVRSALRFLLSRGDHQGLKYLVFEVVPEGFDAVLRTRDGKPLADVLLADDAALWCEVTRLLSTDALSTVLASMGVATSEGLERLARMPGFQEYLAASPRLRAMVGLLEQWAVMRPILPEQTLESEARLTDSMRRIECVEHVPGVVLDLITEGDIVRLAHGALRFPCRHSLWTLTHEILLNEDYFFSCESAAPTIIDGGAHMGMAICYFKFLFPHSRITAFEPHPELYALALENVARNGWEGVEVLPHALAGARGEATFHISESWSMAGSLAERRANLGDTVRDVTVQCVPLSDYLREPVDFLKLDIEGAEDEVLEEAVPWLHNVANVFCEYHQGAGLGSGRLSRMLVLLEQAGFDVQIGKSHNFQERSRWRPLTHFDGAASMVIWARRRGD